MSLSWEALVDIGENRSTLQPDSVQDAAGSLRTRLCDGSCIISNWKRARREPLYRYIIKLLQGEQTRLRTFRPQGRPGSSVLHIYRYDLQDVPVIFALVRIYTFVSQLSCRYGDYEPRLLQGSDDRSGHLVHDHSDIILWTTALGEEHWSKALHFGRLSCWRCTCKYTLKDMYQRRF